MKFVIALFFIAVFLFYPFPVSAHQPHYEDGNTQIRVNDPDISQAFYGELKGKPVEFYITTDEPLKLYAGLLAPDLAGARTDFRLEAYDSGGGRLFELEGGKWEKYFEEFARDDYLKGPDHKVNVPAGNYKLVLSTPKNQGKYVVVVGEKEVFPLSKMPMTFDQLIKVKTEIFGKPWYSAFLNIFGGAILIVLILTSLLLFLLFKLLRRKRGNQILISL